MLKSIIIAACALLVALSTNAQTSPYEVKGNRLTYNGSTIQSFDGIYYLAPGLIAYRNKDSWTISDTTGKRLFKGKYTDVSPQTYGPIILRDGKKTGFVSRSGQLIIDAICTDYNMIAGGFIRIAVDNKAGLLSPAGQLILQPKYDGVEFIANSPLIVIQQGCKTKYVDADGKSNAAGKIPIKTGCLIGFVDSSGKELIKPKYDDYATTGAKSGLVQVMLNGLSGLINSDGIEVLAPKYDWINQSAGNYGYMQVRVGDKMGLIDSTGHEILTPEYESAFALSPELVAVKQNEKWGVIDLNGNQKVPNEYETIATLVGSRILVKQSGKWGIIDTTGKAIVAPKYDRVDHNSFSKGMLPVRERRQILLVDLNGRELLGDIGTQNTKLSNGSVWVRNAGKWELTTTAGVVTNFEYDKLRWYSPQLTVAYKDGKAGLLDATGKAITAFIYDTVKYVSADVACVVSGKKNGLVNAAGKMVLPLTYYMITPMGNGISAVCQGEYEVITRNGLPARITVCRWGFADSTGKMLVKPAYDDFEPFLKGFAPISLNRKQGLIDSTGKVILEPKYDKITAFQGDLAFVKADGKWGLIDRSGRVLIEPTFTSDYRLELKTVSPALRAGYYPKFYKGYATVFNGRKFGLVNSKGKVIVEPIYDQLDILDEPTNKMVALVKSKKKWGAVDASGTEVVKPQYLSLYQFSSGLGRAIKGNKYGYIDEKGTEVIPEWFDKAGVFNNGWATVSIQGHYFLIDTQGNPMLVK